MKQNKSLQKVLFAGMAGNALEFYDFCIYAFFTVQLGAIFFPSHDPMISTLSSLAVFAVGFVMRPIGALVFGHIGDKYGRRKALMLSVTLMALPTFCIGLLPGYTDIGIWAPVLLIICRLFQGLSTGGAYNGAAVFVVEHTPLRKRAFAGSMITSSSYIGWFMASIVSYAFVADFMPPWAWRVPFLFGLVVGMIGLYLRRKIAETPEFEDFARSEKPKSIPFLWVLKTHPRSVFCTFGIASFSGVIVFTTLTYIMTYLLTFAQWEKPLAMLVVMAGSLLYVLLSPLFGMLADKKDPRTICLWSIGVILACVYPVFSLWSSGQWQAVILGQIIWATVTIAYQAPMNLIMARLFPVAARYSGIGIGYCLGMALFGGTSPFISTWLVETFKNPLSPILWITGVGVLGFVAVFLARPLQDKAFEEKEELIPSLQEVG